MTTRIALVGDFNEAVLAHRAIPQALAMSAQALGITLDVRWLATDTLRADDDLAGFAGVWCVPASPYRSMDGALLAIRHARTRQLPFLGTCGGFQHAIVEYARNVLGWADADHAETAPDAARAVIVPLACSLVEVAEPVIFRPGSRIAEAYATEWIEEGYHCRYGLADGFRDAAFADGALRIGAVDEHGDVRAIELRDHPFFVATLFQPERAALRGDPCPLVRAFVAAAGQDSLPAGSAGTVRLDPADR
ncbi:CTP synthase C-terminal region-related (seleno)protein [Montanilutibacter psychrotolerans]|uniref:CTP synthase C-terminal region-related (seleno)protein n=1 Tax=Montanilutibacter psychrotolerans TaxID=1327343 RepID=UPI0021DFBA4F|nr:CTP synthase [Lysobacter psychrotolerans]